MSTDTAAGTAYAEVRRWFHVTGHAHASVLRWHRGVGYARHGGVSVIMFDPPAIARDATDIEYIAGSVAIALSLLLSGCSTVGTLSNRASCTRDRSQMLVSSMWGAIGITSIIDPADAAVACAAPEPTILVVPAPARKGLGAR